MNGDLLMLCSDGLTDLVDDLEILSYVQENSPEEDVQKLTDLQINAADMTTSPSS